jgi:hypothetical protein
MALERFIPKSPDIFIRNSQDFEVAKFGHLNTIVEYINNNSAKPAGLNGYVQFNNNSALGGDAGLFWDNVNKRLGVGTTTPSSTLIVNGVTGINNSLYLGNTDSFLSTNRFQILNAGNTLAMVNVDGGGSISTTGRFQIFNSTKTNIAQAMYYDGATMVFRPMNDGVESTSFRNNAQTLNILNFNGVNGNVDLNFTGASLGAKLGIRGSGSTSATNSLLVQNSSASELLKVTDNGLVTGASITSTGTLNAANNKLEIYNSSGNEVRLRNPSLGNYFYIGPSNVCGCDTSFVCPNIFISGGGLYGSSTGIATNTQAYAMSTQLNPVASANSCLINLNSGGRLQGGAYGQYIRVEGNMTLDSPANQLIGFYFNPTLIGAYSNQNVFAFQSTYGGGYFNTATPQASAILQADSTTQGFLPPRLTTAQKVTLAATAVSGLMIYDTNLNKLCVYTGAGWETITSI